MVLKAKDIYWNIRARLHVSVCCSWRGLLIRMTYSFQTVAMLLVHEGWSWMELGKAVSLEGLGKMTWQEVFFLMRFFFFFGAIPMPLSYSATMLGWRKKKSIWITT